jgi:hypothetical protein
MPVRVVQLMGALAACAAAAVAALRLGIDLGFVPSPLLSPSSGLGILFAASYGVAVAHLLWFGRLWLRRTVPAAGRRWVELVLLAVAVFAAALLLGWLFHAVV